jgi:hypothetical protein
MKLNPAVTGTAAALSVALLALSATQATGIASGAADRNRGAASTPFKITSTLDGKTELPRRMRWIATPSLPAYQVSKVQFFIDGGKPRWEEEHAPYTYGEDENGRHQNYLVTSWLTPGRHRFTVRVLAVGGRKAQSTVVARVLPTPAPPATLAGTWRRTIDDTSGAPAAGTAGNPTETHTPPGTYTMVVEKRWIQMRFPGAYRLPKSETTGEGWILDSDYTAGPSIVRALGSVVFRPFHDEAEGGQWCWEDGPPSQYMWSVSGDTLMLTPVGGLDACPIRGFVWAGEWTRG